eukprot:2730703-Prymnesium_polylepis.1
MWTDGNVGSRIACNPEPGNFNPCRPDFGLRAIRKLLHQPLEQFHRRVYKTAYISLKNNPGGRENLFKKILATAETRTRRSCTAVRRLV